MTSYDNKISIRNRNVPSEDCEGITGNCEIPSEAKEGITRNREIPSNV